ncbi:gamma-glutamylcyclotransferase [Amyelois transitella]|uniref:gamma-glutamylcyclotransferase n=1 Tax=Amyelois transitella TaxID=680683 RepID=UPI00067B1953|nr:gamma-glutamylcyclotransferase [Amyelois transitella]
MNAPAIKEPDSFLYFAYGANILPYRMRMYNLSPEFVSIARIENYRLDFIKYSKYWGGPTATLVPTANAHAWGIIWRMKISDRDSLDGLKEVEVKKYYVKIVEVLTPYMGYFRCRTYIQKVNPLPRGDKDTIPVEQWPSWSYQRIMLLGAIVNELPEYYISFLRKLKHNDDEGCVRTDCLLVRYSREPPCECRVPGRIPRLPLKLDLKTRNVRVQAQTR